jgi:hypothetical protein
MNENTKDILTNPSTEIWSLATFFSRWEKTNSNLRVFNALAESISVDSSSREFLEIVAAIKTRIYKLKQFAETVQDEHLSDDLRKDVILAAEAFAKLFDPANFAQSWTESKKSLLTESRLKSFLYFGKTAQSHRPLRRIADAERDDVLSRIAEVSVNIEHEEIPEWTRSALLSGLDRLQLLIKHVRFFGHDLCIEQIILLHRQVEILACQLDPNETSYRISISAILKVINAIILAANLYCVPDQFLMATERYRSALLPSTIHSAQTFLNEHQKYLPAPSEQNREKPAAIAPAAPQITKNGDDESDTPDQQDHN